MTMLSWEPAICHKCGHKQLFTKVITWNMWLDPKYPADNRCGNCGEEINYNDIDLNSCSPMHRYEYRYSIIYDKYRELYDDDSERKCPNCNSDMDAFSTIGIKLPDKYKNKKEYHVVKSGYVCSNCDTRIYDTEYDICDDMHDFVDYGENEHEYIVKDSDNYRELWEQHQKEFDSVMADIEIELVSQGIITSRQEKEKYEKDYYEKLDKKFKRKNTDNNF